MPGTPSGSLVNLNFNGYYSHTLNNDSVYFNLYCESIYVSASVGLDEVKENTIKIYPNPAQSKITIESPFSRGEVEIFNCMGVECMRNRITQNREDISLESLSNGIYFISVRFKEKVVTERLVIVK